MGMASVLGSPPPIAVAMTTFSGFGWLLGSVVLGHRVLPQAIAVYDRSCFESRLHKRRSLPTMELDYGRTEQFEMKCSSASMQEASFSAALT